MAGQGRQQCRKHPRVGEGGSGHPGRRASPWEEAWYTMLSPSLSGTTVWHTSVGSGTPGCRVRWAANGAKISSCQDAPDLLQGQLKDLLLRIHKGSFLAPLRTEVRAPSVDSRHTCSSSSLSPAAYNPLLRVPCDVFLM